MKHQVFSLDFRREGGIAYPANPKLHKLVIEWAGVNLAKMPNLSDYLKVWAACMTDDAGEPVNVEGLLWGQQIIDFPGFRYLTPWAAKALIDRARDYLDDAGLRGFDVLVHISTTEEPGQKCPEWADWTKYAGAVPADRFKIKVW